MQRSAEQHIFVTGACGAGKSTLAKALSQQLQLPLHAGAPGSVVARQRVVLARQIYESLRPELDAFRLLPGVEMVPRRAFTTWLPQQGSGRGIGSGLAS
jgi:dephospho-CoA kinase